MFNPLLCALFPIKSYDYEQDFHLYHITKPKKVDKTLEQCFRKEFEATPQNSSKSELKQQEI